MDNSYKTALLAANAAADKKANDIKILNIKEISIIADYFIITSGNSTLHVNAIYSNIEKKLAEKNINPLRIEGLQESRWVLMDYGDVIVHIFLEEEREFYSLETLWGDAKLEEFSN